jgi:hypothetical protein
LGSSPTVCSVHLLDKAHHQTQPVNAAMVKGSEGGRHRGVAREKLGEDKRNVKGEWSSHQHLRWALRTHLGYTNLNWTNLILPT